MVVVGEKREGGMGLLDGVDNLPGFVGCKEHLDDFNRYLGVNKPLVRRILVGAPNYDLLGFR